MILYSITLQTSPKKPNFSIPLTSSPDCSVLFIVNAMSIYLYISLVLIVYLWRPKINGKKSTENPKKKNFQIVIDTHDSHGILKWQEQADYCALERDIHPISCFYS